ncbi:MAG: hypothetical protein AAF623_05340 [Planctomycetota bacterium]
MANVWLKKIGLFLMILSVCFYCGCDLGTYEKRLQETNSKSGGNQTETEQVDQK